MTGSISFADFLESPVRRPGIRRDIDLISRVQERASRLSDWDETPGFAGADPAVRQRLRKAFPQGPLEMLDLMSDGAGEHLNMVISRGEPLIEIFGTGGGIASLRRVFKMDADRLLLRRLRLDPAAQNDGKGVRILLGTLEAAKRLGMRRMALDAHDAGSYVWARAGFLPTAAGWNSVRETAARRLPAVGAGEDAGREIRAILDRKDPKAIWALADIEHEAAGEKVAKQLLDNNQWQGEFEVGDAGQTARLKEYAKSRGA